MGVGAQHDLGPGPVPVGAPTAGLSRELHQLHTDRFGGGQVDVQLGHGEVMRQVRVRRGPGVTGSVAFRMQQSNPGGVEGVDARERPRRDAADAAREPGDDPEAAQTGQLADAALLGSLVATVVEALQLRAGYQAQAVEAGHDLPVEIVELADEDIETTADVGASAGHG